MQGSRLLHLCTLGTHHWPSPERPQGEGDACGSNVWINHLLLFSFIAIFTCNGHILNRKTTQVNYKKKQPSSAPHLPALYPRSFPDVTTLVSILNQVQWFPIRGRFCLPGDIWQCLEASLVVTLGVRRGGCGELLASSG